MINNLRAAKRETKTKGQLNILRTKGFIPAILYGGKSPNLKISIEEKFVKDILRSENFLSTVFDIDIDGKKEKVIPREVTYHVLSERPTHIDFMRIVGGSEIILEIPVKFKNNEECAGLKKGGVLNIVRRKIELKCHAENIPNDIIVEVPANKSVRKVMSKISRSPLEIKDHASWIASNNRFILIQFQHQE